VALLDRAVVRLLPAVPRSVVRRVSSRYIAGPRLEDAVATVRGLNAAGQMATVDVLGEEVTAESEAAAFVAAYEQALDAIDHERLDANVSVKPTALGLGVDPELCVANFQTVVEHAARLGTFVRIDMEDSSTTEATLALYWRLRQAGRDNVGVVLQSRLRRTVGDVRQLAPLRPNVRLCKGIYVEPPALAFRDADDVRDSFVQALGLLLDQGCYAGIATHDEALLEAGLRLVGEHGLEPGGYEFQMLLGVREDRARELVAAGHRLRVYVPFGEQWHEYSIRRLQENPQVVRYIAADTARRLLPRRNGSR
jgi:proline dehydrogenase